jgi:hypothetical protein
MNLFSKVKSWFSSNQQTSSKVDHTEVFRKVCTAHGLGDKYIDQTNAVELFNAWYEGDGSEEDVLNSMRSFMDDHPIVYAKFVRFFK